MYSFTDMWAIGAILAELFTLSPLFPGETYVLISTFHRINPDQITYISLYIMLTSIALPF